MTGSPFPRRLAALRGAVGCQRARNALILTGRGTESADERLILTFIMPALADIPGALADVEVLAVGEHRYRIDTPAQGWDIEARSVHLHRDIGNALDRAIPPRPAPLRKRLFWRVVLALAATRAGKRLLSSLRSSRRPPAPAHRQALFPEARRKSPSAPEKPDAR